MNNATKQGDDGNYANWALLWIFISSSAVALLMMIMLVRCWLWLVTRLFVYKHVWVPHWAHSLTETCCVVSCSVLIVIHRVNGLVLIDPGRSRRNAHLYLCADSHYTGYNLFCWHLAAFVVYEITCWKWCGEISRKFFMRTNCGIIDLSFLRKGMWNIDNESYSESITISDDPPFRCTCRLEVALFSRPYSKG